MDWWVWLIIAGFLSTVGSIICYLGWSIKWFNKDDPHW